MAFACLLFFVSPAHAEAPIASFAVASVAVELPSVAVLNSALVKACICESGQGTGHINQYNIHTGDVLHGAINPKDIGACQINEYWNGEEATAHGWDIYTLDGNIRMANFLYETQGLSPWSWSKPCWGDAILK